MKTKNRKLTAKVRRRCLMIPYSGHLHFICLHLVEHLVKVSCRQGHFFFLVWFGKFLAISPIFFFFIVQINDKQISASTTWVKSKTYFLCRRVKFLKPFELNFISISALRSCNKNCPFVMLMTHYAKYEITISYVRFDVHEHFFNYLQNFVRNFSEMTTYYSQNIVWTKLSRIFGASNFHCYSTHAILILVLNFCANLALPVKIRVV